MVKVEYGIGSCAYLSDETAQQLAYEDEIFRQNEEWERWASEWLSDPKNENDPCYSDIFKDYYGFRPKW